MHSTYTCASRRSDANTICPIRSRTDLGENVSIHHIYLKRRSDLSCCDLRHTQPDEGDACGVGGGDTAPIDGAGASLDVSRLGNDRSEGSTREGQKQEGSPHR